MTKQSDSRTVVLAAIFLALAGLLGAAPAEAQQLASQERMCDPTFEDCRADILTYIFQETEQIDIAFWMMSDARYSNALVAARNRGVTVRVLMDPRCSQSHSACVGPLDQLRLAGFPMRAAAQGILHWKAIIFASQGQVEFSGANYVPFELTPHEPWVNFTDEIVYFSNDPSVVRSMMTKFDDMWTSTTAFYNYANITTPLTRSYPIYTLDPDMNFPPSATDSYRARAVAAYDAEQHGIDVLMFRITDLSHTRAMQRAVQRGVPVRLITDETEYRNPKRIWHAYNVDILYRAGVQVRLDAHLGLNHAKGVILRGSGLSIFGSSNWSSPSSDQQHEHNYFTTKPAIFSWMTALFDRKWTNATGHSESKPLVPLPPNVPVMHEPANNATGVPTTGVMLKWNGGIWAHLYDVYFGTTPDPPLYVSNREMGPSLQPTYYRTFPIEKTLQPGTRYYWRIVSKTMAHVTADGPVWSFTTAGTAPNNQSPSVAITSPAAGASFTAPANITVTSTASDSDGTVTKVELFANGTRVGTSTAAPFTIVWNNAAAGSYNLTAVATDNGNASTTSSPIAITVAQGQPPPTGLPSGWSASDVGATGATGSSTFANGVFSVTGAGADVWGTSDQFQYAYQTLTGDGSIVARVASVQYVNAWTKAGVMIRNSLSPSAAQAFQLVAASSVKGVPFQRRPSDGATSVSSPGSQSTAPRWVKLVRAGNLITGYESGDGVTWTVVGSDTFAMGSTVFVGLAVSSHVTGVKATATFDNVTISTNAPPPPPPNQAPTVSLTSPASGATYTAPATISIAASASDSDGTVTKVDFFAGSSLLGTDTAAPYLLSWSNVPAGSVTITAVATDDDGATTTSAPVTVTVSTAPPPPPDLPSGWSHADIGATAIAGDATFSNGVYTVKGSGADVWGTVDAFHFAYRTLTGDGAIVARVTSIPQGIHAWVKAGVMIRSSLAANSPHGFMLASAAKGMAFQRRAETGGVSTNSAGTLSTAPRWVKLQRNGNLFSAYESADGANWTLVGTESIVMGTTVYVGLAVTSHNNGVATTCTFDSVSIQ